jgi:hypothetical protein
MKDMNQNNKNTSTLYAGKKHSTFNNYKSPNTKNPNISFAPKDGVTFSESSFDKRKMKCLYCKKLGHLIKHNTWVLQPVNKMIIIFFDHDCNYKFLSKFSPTI